VLTLNIDIEDWPETADWEALAEKSALAALAQTPFAALSANKARAELSISFADNNSVQALNAEWRDKDKPTNVLSFPMLEPEELPDVVAGKALDGMLGDIILARQVCEQEALDKGISTADHAAHLIVHGTLHIFGYDHIDDDEGDAMEALERSALASLGIADPYDDHPEV
jgi:probable rRNA maturation factor